MIQIIMLLTNPFKPDPRVYKEAKALVNQGFEVTIFCWDREGRYPVQETCEGINIVRKKIRSHFGAGFALAFDFLKFWFAIIQYLWKNNSDIIHCHDFDTLIPGALIAWIKKRKIIFDSHIPYPEKMKLSMNRKNLIKLMIFKIVTATEIFISKRVSKIFTDSEEANERFLQWGINTEKVTDIINTPSIDTFDLKKYLPSATKQLTLGRVGLISKKTGADADETIDSVIELIEEGLDIRLILVGDIVPLDYKTSIMNKTRKYSKNIQIKEFVPFSEINQLYNEIDISIILYNFKNLKGNIYEKSFPTKLFESMAKGVPVIIRSSRSAHRIVEQSDCGKIVSDIQSTKNAIRFFYQNQDLLPEYGIRGRNYFEKQINWEIEKKKIITTYQSLLGEKNEDTFS